MNTAYRETVALLLDVMPATFESPHFAMKGGTAINLFLQDMPRLSVDIDIAYANREATRADALQDISRSLAKVAEKLAKARMRVQQAEAEGSPESKLLISRQRSVVKIEVNTVLRGTVLPVETRELAPAAQAEFKKYVEVPTLANPELYGGKLVALLDRQHPRDLFDAMFLLRSRKRITKDVLQCFVIYLASHNRPAHELLEPKLKDIRTLFENELQGMTAARPTLDELLETREQVVRQVNIGLTRNQRTFLVTLMEGEPDWAASGIAHAFELPGLLWKLQNVRDLKQRNPKKHRAMLDALAATLG